MPRKKPPPKISRLYTTPFGIKASVTSIIEATTPVKDRAALEKWAEKVKKGLIKAPDSKEAQEKGTAVHALRVLYLEEYRRTGSSDIDICNFFPVLGIDKKEPEFIEAVFNLFNQLIPYYKGYQEILWMEEAFPSLLKKKPELANYSWTDPQDGKTKGFLYHKDFIYAGCPDDIVYLDYKGERLLTLIDLKTSKRPYLREKPPRPWPSVFAEAKKERMKAVDRGLSEEDADGPATKQLKVYREQSAGWHAFKKCAMQIAAYKPLAEACLDIQIDKVGIMVTCPKKPQYFRLSPAEVTEYANLWNERLAEFRENLFPTIDPSTM